MKRNLTGSQKQQAIQLHMRGFKISFIAKQFRCHRVSISRIVNGWKRGQYITPKVRAQRRLKLTAQQVHNVLSYFVKNPFDTYNQCIQKLKLPVKYGAIARLLSRNGIRNYVASYKHFLSIQNQIKRLKFAIKHQHWTEADWAKVSFIDEKSVQTYANGRLLVKREVGERYNPVNIYSQEKQNTKNKINLVGVVSYNGPNMLYSVSTKLKGDEFEQLMRLKVKNVVRHNIVLMDNASIHNMGLDYLVQSGVRIINDWPPKSPDLNIIENVWGKLQKILNRKLRHRTISTKEQLLQLVEESWSEIPVGFIRNCILSMPKRVKEVIKMNGKQTRF